MAMVLGGAYEGFTRGFTAGRNPGSITVPDRTAGIFGSLFDGFRAIPRVATTPPSTILSGSAPIASRTQVSRAVNPSSFGVASQGMLSAFGRGFGSGGGSQWSVAGAVAPVTADAPASGSSFWDTMQTLGERTLLGVADAGSQWAVNKAYDETGTYPSSAVMPSGGIDTKTLLLLGGLAVAAIYLLKG